MVLREPNDPLNQSRGIMGSLQNSAVESNRGRLRQRFDLIRKLGQGTYGKVQLGIDKETGQEVAIKTIKKSKIETEADLIRIRREIQIMSSVRHPNIIHIYEVFENREKMVLVMEYAAGGELYDYLNERKILQEDEARRIFRQIASAVYYCHKHKICHRDLKLENILLDEKSNAKIADFGLSNVFSDGGNLLKTFCGSPLYASPEIVCGSPYIGPEVDCWSLGVLLYTLVYGSMPFDGGNFKRLVKQISNGDYYEPKKPAEASSLIRRMLTVDPIKRATIKDVCSHKWINDGFDKPCLSNAEELANQTPVRLDLLLSLAPAHNVNHSQIICDQNQNEAGSVPIPGTSTSDTSAKPSKGKEKTTAPIEKPARTSLLNKNKVSTPGDATPSQSKEPVIKKKPSVKKKSKSSPILELIVDVEEENEPLEIIDAAGEGDDDDEAGDTLSEISEIQTIAEDIKEDNKSKSKVKLKETSKAVPEQPISSKPTVVKEEKKKETKVAASKPVIVQAKEKEKVKHEEITEKVKPEENKEKEKPAEKKEKEKPVDLEKEKETKEKQIVKEKEKERNEKQIVKEKEKERNEKQIVKEKEKERNEKQIVKEKEKEKTVEDASVISPTKENKEKPKTVPSSAIDKEKPKTDNEGKAKITSGKTTIASKDESPVKVPEKDKVTTTTHEKKSEPKEIAVTPATESAVKGDKDVPPVTKPEEEPKAEATATTVPKKPPTVIKKKVVKKVVKASPSSTGEDSDKGVGKSSLANTESSSSVASSAGKHSGTKLDKDGSSSSAGKAPPKLRARSDSNSSDANSPTRIERRSSKIISQKTAELIQNLETKTSTSSTDSGKAKKLVFPSLTKVSDAKNKFEKPPKPLNTSSSTSGKPPGTLKATSSSSGSAVKTTSTTVEKEKEIVKRSDSDEPSEQQQLKVKAKKPKSKSPSPCVDEQKIASTKKQEETIEINKEKEQTEVEKVPKKSPNVQRKSEANKEISSKVDEPTTTPIVEQTTESPKEKTESPSSQNKQVKTNAENKSLDVSNQSTKQKSPSPKPEKKKVPISKKEEEIVEKSQDKTIPIAVVNEDDSTSHQTLSPEPDTQTFSDDLNTEIDNGAISEISEVPASKKVGVKPLKKLKIQTNSQTDQLVKPVLVDNGNGPPKQAVMLVHGKTTPPVKSTAELDSASISTDPFFSQSESVSVTLPLDKNKQPVKVPSTPNKEQAVKKISSVISRIASSESTDRMAEDGKNKLHKPPNKIKTEVSFPVVAAPSQERIIPIKFSDDTPTTPQTHGTNPLASSSKTQSAPNISRIPPRKVDASSSSIFSRQNSSDTESSLAGPCKPEPIRKSPREFIIPIKLEHSGQTLTPKDDVAEASNASMEDPFRMDSRLRSGRFGRHKRYSSLLSDSSLEEEPVSVSASATTSRRSSTATNATTPTHARSLSQGDEPETPLGTFKRYRMRRSGVPLDRSDSFSSAEEEDDEDCFEVLTAENLFSNLLDRVKNLTRRLNREDGSSTNWPGQESPGFGLWNTSNPLREFMSRAPSETRSIPPGSYTMTRSFSREPSVTVTVSHGPTWRRSLSRESSEYSEPQSAASATSNNQQRSGSGFQPRGSVGYSNHHTDSIDNCTVRSLPLNLGSSTRRSPFRKDLPGRSEQGADASCSSFGNSLSTSTTASSISNPVHTARPYSRTMSNNEYSTSVTLPFRRSLKSYDRPPYNEYSPSSTSSISSASHLNHYNPTSDHFLGSSTSSHHPLYGLPHRSNSVIGSRYGSSNFNSNIPTVGASQLNSSTPDSSSSPYTSRYSRSMSRVRSTPEPDTQRFRDRDFSSNNVSHNNHNLNNSMLMSSYSNNSHSNNGNNNPSADSTSTPSEGSKMTTQEKMNSYQNYYATLSQNPLRRINIPESPALANYTDDGTMNNNNNNNNNNNGGIISINNSRASVDRVLPAPSVMSPNSIKTFRYDQQQQQQQQQQGVSTLGQMKSNNSVIPPKKSISGIQRATRELSSPPMIVSNQNGNGFVETSSPGTSEWNNNINNNSNANNSIPKWPNISVKTHRPVNVSNFVDPNQNVTNITTTNGPQIVKVTSSPSQPYVSTVKNYTNQILHENPNPEQNQNRSLNPVPNQNSTMSKSVDMTSSSPPPLEAGNYANQHHHHHQQQQPQQKAPLPKRDARATSVEKISRFLERKSVPRVVSPPPMPGSCCSSDVSVCSSPVNPLLSTSQSSSAVSVINNVNNNINTNSDENIVQSGSDMNTSRSSCNSSPDKFNRSFSVGQKMTKPSFIKTLEKKWEKLTTTSGNATKGNTAPIMNSDEIPTKDGNNDIASFTTNNTNSNAGGCEDDDDNLVSQGKLDSESLYLQRAVSPEKKSKKFGSSTVNFMLGKFRRIEESGNSSSNNNANSSSSKPPLTGVNTRIGRRVQSVYAGATSDSALVLGLPNRPNVTVESTNNSTNSSQNLGLRKPLTLQIGSRNTNNTSSNSNNNNNTSNTCGEGEKEDININSSTSSLLLIKNNNDTTTTTTTSCSTNNNNTTTNSTNNETISSEDTNKSSRLNKLRRPLSLGIFSNPTNSTATVTTNASSTSTPSSSFIPRFSKQNVAAASSAAALNSTVAGRLKSPEIVTSPLPITTTTTNQQKGRSNSSSASNINSPTSQPTTPQIHVTPDRITNAVGGGGDEEPLTPTSISDSFDSSSVCSEKTEMSVRSCLDDEESVEERIRRKSYYNRFNSLDRKNRSSSVCSSSPRTTTKLSGSGSSPSSGKKTSSRSSVSPGIYTNPIGSGTTNSSSVISGSNNNENSGHASVINKYNPNPLFKELLMTDSDWDVGRKSKAEYSRRVTSKLSKLLREIESDIGNTNETGTGSSNSNNRDQRESSVRNNYLTSNASCIGGGRNRESLSPSPAKMLSHNLSDKNIEHNS